jgi:hypothetical protein
MPWYEPADPNPREQCPCCGYITLPERGMSLICPVCYWDDEGFVGDRLGERSVSNKMTLREARETLQFSVHQSDQCSRMSSNRSNEVSYAPPVSNRQSKLRHYRSLSRMDDTAMHQSRIRTLQRCMSLFDEQIDEPFELVHSANLAG